MCIINIDILNSNCYTTLSLYTTAYKTIALNLYLNPLKLYYSKRW